MSCQQGTLTPWDTWSRPIWDLHMLNMLEQVIFSNSHDFRPLNFLEYLFYFEMLSTPRLSLYASQVNFPRFHYSLIGCSGGLKEHSFAMLCAAGGYRVSIYDIEPAQVECVLKEIHTQRLLSQETGFLRGKLSASEQESLITGTNDLAECVKGALFSQVRIDPMTM